MYNNLNTIIVYNLEGMDACSFIIAKFKKESSHKHVLIFIGTGILCNLPIIHRYQKQCTIFFMIYNYFYANH